MQARLAYFGCGLVVVALAAGCASTSGPQPPSGAEQLTLVKSTLQEVLQNELAKAGLCDTDLVFETTMTFPVPAEGDKNPRPAWKGVFLGREEATLQVKDQMLVIAKTMQCNEVETRYMFNPFTRTWGLEAQRTPPEGNRLWVLFSGNASEFFHDVSAAKAVRHPLASLVTHPKLIVPETFPANVCVDDMLAILTELGLSTLDAHLKAEHATGNPCKPDVHVYIKPAASR